MLWLQVLPADLDGEEQYLSMHDREEVYYKMIAQSLTLDHVAAYKI